MQVRTVVLFLVVAGCSKPASRETPTTPPEAGTDTGKGAGANAACAARAADFDRVLASASKKCTTDKDCACFRGGVSKSSPCGDITDAKTNERLEAIAKDWSAAGCTNEAVMCPAMVCDPTCNAGTCGPRQLIQ